MNIDFERGDYIAVSCIVIAFVLSGCTTTQSNAKDMVEYMMSSNCKITKVDVREKQKRFSVSTDCSDAD